MIKKGHELSDEQIAQQYDAMHAAINEPGLHYKKVSRELSKYSSSSILEIGCGQGKLLKLIKNHKDFDLKNYHGIDINNGFVNSTREQTPYKEQVQIGTIYSIPFDAHSFDIVILMDVLEHLKEPVRALKEINRVLKKGGKVILTLPNGTAFEPTRKLGEATANKLLRYMFLSWEHPLKSKQPIDTVIYYHEFQDMFAQAGFGVQKVEGWNYFPYLYSLPKINQGVSYLMLPFNRIFDSLGWQDRGYSLLVVLEKKEN